MTKEGLPHKACFFAPESGIPGKDILLLNTYFSRLSARLISRGVSKTGNLLAHSEKLVVMGLELQFNCSFLLNFGSLLLIVTLIYEPKV